MGTTGAAKGVILTHPGVIKNRAANARLGLGSQDTVLWVLPMAYHFFVSIVLYLHAGAAIIICPDHWAGSVMNTAAEHGATFLYAAPMQIRVLMAAAAERALPSTLSRVMSVSSRLDPQTARSFHRRYGVPVAQGYGVIEVGLPIANLEDAAEHPEAIGHPLPAYEVGVLDSQLRPVANGDSGQLALRGPGMFAGYLSPLRSRAEVLRDGWFLTGDLAHRNERGLLVLNGRSMSVINVAGHKVFPGGGRRGAGTAPVRVVSRASPGVRTRNWERWCMARFSCAHPVRPAAWRNSWSFAAAGSPTTKSRHPWNLVSEIDATGSGKARHG